MIIFPSYSHCLSVFSLKTPWNGQYIFPVLILCLCFVHVSQYVSNSENVSSLYNSLVKSVSLREAHNTGACLPFLPHEAAWYTRSSPRQYGAGCYTDTLTTRPSWFFRRHRHGEGDGQNSFTTEMRLSAFVLTGAEGGCSPHSALLATVNISQYPRQVTA